MRNHGYYIDRDERTITLTRNFRRQMNIIGSPEYELFIRMKADFADFRITPKTIKRNPEKETHAGLSYENMRLYIALITNGDTGKIEELETMRKISKLHKASYTYVKNWFLTHYGDYKKFDITELRDVA